MQHPRVRLKSALIDEPQRSLEHRHGLMCIGAVGRLADLEIP
jgi:hypothetical protein